MNTKKKTAKKVKKRPVKKVKTQKPCESVLILTGIAAKIFEDKGEKWVKKTCGTTEPTTGSLALARCQIADLVYFHYLQSDEGKKVWDCPGQNNGKVDYIFDSIYDKYHWDLAWMTEDEWEVIADDIYSMVYEGVF